MNQFQYPFFFLKVSPFLVQLHLRPRGPSSPFLVYPPTHLKPHYLPLLTKHTYTLSSVIFPPKKPLFQQKPNPATSDPLFLSQGKLARWFQPVAPLNAAKDGCYKNCNKRRICPSALKHPSPYMYIYRLSLFAGIHPKPHLLGGQVLNSSVD